jgi:hypothetical protein
VPFTGRDHDVVELDMTAVPTRRTADASTGRDLIAIRVGFPPFQPRPAGSSRRQPADIALARFNEPRRHKATM